MQFLIGIDGGGSKTKTVISDLSLLILHTASGGASNFLVNDKQDVAASIREQISECISHIKLTPDDELIIVIGTAGAGRKKEAELFKDFLLNFLNEEIPCISELVIESDALITLEGAFEGKTGAIMISGTGSIMFAKDENGTLHRVGGFGRLIGDEGSGFRIGMKGLNILSKFFDGRIEHTLLNKLIPERFGLLSSEILINKIYKENFDIASIAPVVIYAAKKSDPYALKIIDEETEELISHIKAMLKKIKTDHLNLVLTGGLLLQDTLFTKTLRTKISNEFSSIRIVEPSHPPEKGALLIAKRIAENKIDRHSQ